MTEPNVAVLIDYENVGLDAIEYLLDQLSDVGRVIIKRAYADWSMQRGKQDQLLELGIEPMHHYRSSKSGKNSSDICLAIDAVDLLFQAPIDTFVIVSSDSDFVPLVNKLRAAGKAIIGSGRRGVTSSTLVKSCDRYIYLEDAKTPKKKTRSRSGRAQVESLVARAVEASMDGQGRVVGSKLHQTMQRIDPSFDFRAMGHRTFTMFLQSCKEVRVERPKDASDVIVYLSNGRDHSSGPASNGGGGSTAATSVVASATSTGGSSNGASATDDAASEAPATSWDREIDAAWAKRNQKTMSGRVAASDAAKVLGVSKLSVSKYPSLDKLLGASEVLRAKWRRDGNSIIRK